MDSNATLKASGALVNNGIGTVLASTLAFFGSSNRLHIEAPDFDHGSSYEGLEAERQSDAPAPGWPRALRGVASLART